MAELYLERLIALVALVGTYLGLALGRLPPASPSSAARSSW